MSGQSEEIEIGIEIESLGTGLAGSVGVERRK